MQTDPHIREAQEFYPQSEAQMCFEEAQLARARIQAQASVKIGEALAAGKFVLVRVHPHHCKATDALTGDIQSFGGAFDTREAAEAARRPDEEDAECHSFVLPETVKASETPEPPEPAGASGEDVPF